MNIFFKNFINLNENELKEVLELRNQEQIRKNMINIEIISLENHILFVENLKKSINNKYFSIFVDDLLIGSINIIKNKELYWGLYYKEDVNPILKSVSTYIFLDFIFANFNEDINSFVKKSNIQALNFNKSFGFEYFKEDEDYYYLKLSKQAWGKRKDSKLIKPIKRYLDKIEYQFKD